MEAESTRLGSPFSSASGKGFMEHSISMAGVNVKKLKDKID